MSWCQETLHLLKNRPISITYAIIEAETGIKIPWLRLFARGRIENPGVNTIEKLRNFLLSLKDENNANRPA